MMAGTLKMMNGKRCRLVKVYRHIDSFYRCIPFIKLQGEWLAILNYGSVVVLSIVIAQMIVRFSGRKGFRWLRALY